MPIFRVKLTVSSAATGVVGGLGESVGALGQFGLDGTGENEMVKVYLSGSP